MARLQTTVQIVQVDLIDLDAQDLRILDMALAMYRDYDNKQNQLSDEIVEDDDPNDDRQAFPLGTNDRLALDALHNHVVSARVGGETQVSG